MGKKINPLYWFGKVLFWVSKIQRQKNLKAAIQQADKIHYETGKKMLVFNTRNSVVLISKQDLKKKKLGTLQGKAFYET